MKKNQLKKLFAALLSATLAASLCAGLSLGANADTYSSEFAVKGNKLLTKMEFYGEDAEMESYTQVTYDENHQVTATDTYVYTDEREVYLNGHEEFTYATDAAGMTTETVFTTYYDETGAVEDKYKSEEICNADGEDVKYISYQWNEEKEEWFAYYTWEEFFDADGKLTQTLWQQYNGSELVPNSKYEYSYAANGFRTLEIGYHWDSEKSDWVENWKYEYKCGPNGRVMESLQSYWNSDDSVWNDPEEKTDYAYDAADRISSVFEYKWEDPAEPGADGWKEYSERQYTYDANGNETCVICYSNWDEETDDWTDVSKNSMEYDANGYVLHDYCERQDEEGAWNFCGYRSDYTRDEFGNELTYIESEWDEETGAYVQVSRTVYIYETYEVPEEQEEEEKAEETTPVVAETPATPATVTSPKTGDNGIVVLWAALAAVAGAAALVVGKKICE